jgi:hypothetical protein
MSRKDVALLVFSASLIWRTVLRQFQPNPSTADIDSMLDSLQSFEIETVAASLGQLKYLVGIFHANCTGQGCARLLQGTGNRQRQSFVSMNLMYTRRLGAFAAAQASQKRSPLNSEARNGARQRQQICHAGAFWWLKRDLCRSGILALVSPFPLHRANVA